MSLLPLCYPFAQCMDKLQLTGRNLGRIFNFKNGRVQVLRFLCYGVKLHKFKLKTRPKQPLGYLLLDIMLPAPYDSFKCHVNFFNNLII
jgi:hypothetical protein